MNDLDDIDELERITNDFLDTLDADPQTVEALRSLWRVHFDLERQQRRELH